MGQLTGKRIRKIVPCDRGSDYYGPCEVCGLRMSQAHKLITGAEYVRANGETYGGHSMAWGHADCLERNVYG
jgi:hypothetical protein